MAALDLPLHLQRAIESHTIEQAALPEKGFKCAKDLGWSKKMVISQGQISV